MFEEIGVFLSFPSVSEAPIASTTNIQSRLIDKVFTLNHVDFGAQLELRISVLIRVLKAIWTLHYIFCLFRLSGVVM